MTIRLKIKIAILVLQALAVGACVRNNSNSPVTTVGPSPSPANTPLSTSSGTVKPRSQVTLAVLDALLVNDNFVSELKSKLQIPTEQVEELKKAAADEVDRLRSSNAEESTADSVDARSRATEQINRILGDEKATQFNTFVSEFWARGGESEASEKLAENSLPITPNSIPTDTRIVVNIPEYRMDLFKDGSLIKSYKIGIGYPEFPLPQGLRKAQTIIFNPTWTPPDSPWVAKMNVTPGEKIEAGSKLNPLGPIKIPIGMPSLIHGGKSPAKLGTFASHGCVGLTTPQVKDFAKMLAEISGSEVSEKSIAAHLKDPTQTQAVKLKQPVPVELRYETIVLEDGKLHVYKDVYDQDTNTEDNLRAVLEANGSRLENLSEEERNQILSALNAMSAHPKPMPSPSVSETKDTQTRKRKVTEKKSVKNQKEVVVELKSLTGRGYPAPVNLDAGTGKSTLTAAVSQR
jgi:lipoprotein-anchoring transpeptidase ErfK/SrfK